jgi:type I restriction enzyme S subunit
MRTEWLRTTIGEQATLQRGFDITKAEQRTGAIPVVSSSGISSWHDTAMVTGPGVVLGRKGVVGSVHFVDQDFWPHDTSLWVREFHGNDPRYVYYFFRAYAQELAALDVGSANPTLNRNHVHPIEVPWPSRLDEQISIAGVLGALDDRISLLRETNATLEAIAQALFKSWFVDFDPVRAKMAGRAPEGMDEATAALFPDALEETDLGLVPKGWRIGSILEVSKLLSGGTPKTDREEFWGGAILWASAKDVSQASDSVLLTTERTITDAGLNGSSTKLIPAYATAVVARGATTGRMVMLGTEMAMNQTCYALVSRQNTPTVLSLLIKREISRLVNAAHGSVFDTITTTTFEKSVCLLPPEALCMQLERVTRLIFDKIISNVAQAQMLSHLRDTLLPRLISGQLRLPEAQAMLEKAVA